MAGKRSRTQSTTRSVRRRTHMRRRMRNRRKRAVKQSYRRINLYRFKREILPSTQSVKLISAAGDFGAMGYFQFKDLTASMMVNFVEEFGNLFASYHVDCIVTTLTPLWEAAIGTQGQDITSATWRSWQPISPQCICTRVNGKYLNAPMTIMNDAEAQREVLAQLQAKRRCKMLRSRPIKMVTKNPFVYQNILEDPDDPTAKEMVRTRQPWLNIGTQSNVEFAHNDTIFIERVDGLDITTEWKFRVQHTFYFRTGFVG